MPLNIQPVNSQMQLAEAIEAFANTNSWTILQSDIDGDGKDILIAKGGLFVRFNTATQLSNILRVNLAAGPDEEDEASEIIAVSNTVGGNTVFPATLQIFTGVLGDYTHMVLVTANRSAACVSFGTLEKFGAYDGGSYLLGHESLVEIFDKSTPVETDIQVGVAGTYVQATHFGMPAALDVDTGNSPLLPITLFHNNAGSLNPLGQVPDLRYLQKYGSFDDLVYGEDTWVLNYGRASSEQLLVAMKK